MEKEEFVDGLDTEYCGQTHQLRYCVILTDKKTKRYIIAMQDIEDYPLSFLREYDDIDGDLYALYKNALTSAQANEILDLMEAGNTQKARILLKKCFKNNDPFCHDVGPVVLDDMIPDDWYLVWKEMEWNITSSKHHPGYYSSVVQDPVY